MTQSQTTFNARNTIEPADNMIAEMEALKEQMSEMEALKELVSELEREKKILLQEQKERLQDTTLHELHQTCHEFHSRFQVEQIEARRTQGTTTSPLNKPCPLLLREWEGFTEQRQCVFNEMLELLPPDTDPRSRIFQSKERLKGIEKFLPRVPIGSEDSTKRFRSLAVEDLLTHMFDKLAKEYSSCREKLGLKDQLVFTNHSNPLQDDNEEVLHRKLVNADQRAAEQKLPSSTKADRLCYTIDRVTIDRVHANDERQSILIVELKAPHKFSKTILQRGLRPMSVKDDVVNKSSIPTTPDERFQHKAEELVAAGLAQAYTYMLQTGLEYGCLETGESTVFLRVGKDTPNTLFYHLAIPQSEVQQFLKTNVGTDTPFPSSLTALGQMSSFVLMALQSLPRPQDWRDAALKGAYVWDPDEEKALRQIPVQDAKPGVESPDFKSKASPAVRKSPYSFRKAGRRRVIKVANIVHNCVFSAWSAGRSSTAHALTCVHIVAERRQRNTC